MLLEAKKLNLHKCSFDRGSRTGKSLPCPLCSKEGCNISSCFECGDIKILCFREVSKKQTNSGAYLHFIKANKSNIKHKPVQEKKEFLAAEQVRDHIYRIFLSKCTLDQQDKDNLLARGLTEEVIKEHGYKSVPKFAIQGKYNLKGIPGFYKDYNGEWTYSYIEGFFIPVKNFKGQIIALQIRKRNVKEDENKYCWFTSRKFDEGTGVPANECIHYASCSETDQDVIITEGYLKANVISFLTGKSVIGIGGIGNFNDDIGEQIKKNILYLMTIKIAYDYDQKERAILNVQHQINRINNSFEQVDCYTKRLTWLTQYKGYDDFLLEKSNLEVTNYEERSEQCLSYL